MRSEEQQRSGLDRRSSFKEQLSTVVLVLSLVSLIFTSGYNWRRVDELTVHAETTDQKFKTIEDLYVKKDVLVEQFNTMNAQLQALRDQIADLKSTVKENGR